MGRHRYRACELVVEEESGKVGVVEMHTYKASCREEGVSGTLGVVEMSTYKASCKEEEEVSGTLGVDGGVGTCELVVVETGTCKASLEEEEETHNDISEESHELVEEEMGTYKAS